MKIAVRMLIMLVAAGVLFGGVFFFDSFRSKMIGQYMKKFSNPTQSVSTVVAQAQPWQRRIEATGSLRAMNGAELSANASGIVDEITFKSGDDVAAGTVLVRLRGEDDPARLAQLQTALALARTNYQRDLRQLQAQAVARATVDADASAVRSAESAVAQQQATMAKKTVTAPFAGHLGIREVDLGQYVGAGTPIVALQALDPIYADFYVSQQDIGAVRVGASVRLTVDAYAGRVFAGTIEAANAAVDTATRTLRVRARIANPDHSLLPGMFATIALTVGEPQSFITLPQTAITYNPYGSTVYLVHPGSVDGRPAQLARQVFVQTGDARGDQVAVLGGITAGETVVVAGQAKLRNGTPVSIDNSLMPSNDPDPHPVEQ